MAVASEAEKIDPYYGIKDLLRFSAKVVKWTVVVGFTGLAALMLYVIAVI